MKRVFVLGVSCIFYLYDQARRVFLHMIGKPALGTCIVVQYHAIPSGLRARFGEQMDTLLRYATPIRADWRMALPNSGNHVAVTFDDGLTSFVENALPELEKRNIPSALFVVVGRLGSVPSWRRHSSDKPWTSIPSVASSECMLTAGQLREISGRVIIGSHSLTHELLTELDVPAIEREVEGSRRDLEAILGRKVTLFSFPYGNLSDKLLPYCKGYERVFTIEPRLALRDPKEFVTGRVSVDPTDWDVEFRLKINGSYRWLPYAVALKRSLLIVVTQMSRSPLYPTVCTYSTRPGDIGAVTEFAPADTPQVSRLQKD